jgi:hypothetical protein
VAPQPSWRRRAGIAPAFNRPCVDGRLMTITAAMGDRPGQDSAGAKGAVGLALLAVRFKDDRTCTKPAIRLLSFRSTSSAGQACVALLAGATHGSGWDRIASRSISRRCEGGWRRRPAIAQPRPARTPVTSRKGRVAHDVEQLLYELNTYCAFGIQASPAATTPSRVAPSKRRGIMSLREV